MIDRQVQDGYVTDTVFPSGYVRHLQPALLSYVAAAAGGYVPPDPGSGFVFLELGCGTGTTLNLLAAANPESQFIGIDFNPRHIEVARAEAAECALDNVAYINSSFENVTIAELPECDYIAIHGAYSWLPPAAEAAVHAIVDLKLRNGGIFLVDYLCAPARVPISPLWYLLRETTRHINGSSEERVAHGMEILRLLGDAGGGYLEQSPTAKRVLDRNLRRIDEHDPNVLRHLAHHALADHQSERYFTEVRDAMRRLGLEYAGNCMLRRNSPELSLPASLREFCARQADAGTSELIKDFTLNQNQRKDVYIKGVERDPDAAADYLGRKVFLISMRPAAGIETLLGKETGDMGPDLISDPAVKTVLEALDDGLSALADLETRCLSLGMGREDVILALNVIVDRPDIHLCRVAPVDADPKPKSDYRPSGQFNRLAETRRKRANRSNLFLASPVTGAGLTLGPGLASAFKSLFAEQSNEEPDDLPTPNVSREFEERVLPRLHRLGIVD